MADINLTHRYSFDGDGPPRDVQPSDAQLDAVGTISSGQIDLSIRAAHENATDMMLYRRIQGFGSNLMEDAAATTYKDEVMMLRYLQRSSQRTAEEVPELSRQAADLANHYANIAHHAIEGSLVDLGRRMQDIMGKELPRYAPPPTPAVPRRGFFARLLGVE